MTNSFFGGVSLRRGRLKFKINIISAIFFALMLFFERSHYAAIALLAAAIHECGHLFMAKALRIPFSLFELDMLGASLRLGSRLCSYGDEFLLASAGPLMNIFSSLALFPLVTHAENPALREYLSFFIFASLALACLNLLPIKSFDGGRMMHSLCSAVLSPKLADLTLRLTTFFSLFIIWSFSLYMLLRSGAELSLFLFSIGLFARIFIQNEN